MQRRDIAALAGTSLFAGIDALELEELVGTTASSVREYGRGNLLLSRGDSYDSLWILVEGSVEAEMQGASGRSVRIETIAAPEPIASAILFAPEPILPVTVRATGSVRVVALPRESVLALCQRSRVFLCNYLSDCGSRIAAFSERFRLMQFATLRERLAVWLLARLDRASRMQAVGASGGGGQPRGEPPAITLPSSKEQLAATFGVTRPSLSRGLGELAREGIVAVEGRTVRVLDAAALRRSIGED